MSAEDDKKTNADDTQKAETEIVPTTADWFLRMMIKWANDSELAFPMTLNVGGVIVSGIMVGGREYFKKFAGEFKKLLGDQDEAKEIEDGIAAYGDIYENKPDGQIEPEFVHLIDAHYLEGSALVPTEGGAIWRGRVSEVDGFSFGCLGSP